MVTAQTEISRDELVSYDPATGLEIGRVPETSPDDVEKATLAARKAFVSWRQTSFKERSRLIMKARSVILSRLDEIAHLISSESGKPFGEAIAMELAPVLDLMQFFARNSARLLRPKKVNVGLYKLLARSSKIVYHPLGVVAIIPAWNYPFSIPLGEAAMALMAGNTVVIKPSELTPLTGLKIGEIFRLAGAPDGVIQIVTGGARTGAALVDSRPDKIMFTGSVATGKKIAKAAAENLTPVVLELGGKDAMIVLDDADLELAASAAVWGAFCNAGQSCSSVERLYVQKAAAGKLTDLIVAKTKQLEQGPGDLESTSVAAMSSERQVRIVEDHIEDFRQGGARILTGGKRNGAAGPLFFEPTIIADADNRMRGMQEETFGPTLPIATFETVDEAVALANDSEFGLTASVWTRDIAKGRRIAARIEAGSVCVNEVLYTHGIGQTPWGGFKNSGLGRTHGLEGLMEMVQPQHIHVNRLPFLPSPWWLPYSPEAVKTIRGFAKFFSTGALLQTARLLTQLSRRFRELLRSSKSPAADSHHETGRK
jgi:succinate-semialdehyde dehydrogenase/glutarate-semialdehyde dehydrogenase